MRPRSFALAIGLILSLVVVGQASAQGVPGPCHEGVLPSGALARICIPAAGWNGSLVVYAHGYVAFNEPLDFYNLELADGTNVQTLVQSLGYAFATTSYRQNGLAILEGADDIRELVEVFRRRVRVPHKTLVAGVSEGGIVATLLAERRPELFTGALAACGPIGSFQKQLDYFGDFRALFDYYYPGLIPGDATWIPDAVIQNWESVFVPAVTGAVAVNPGKAMELLKVAGVAFEPSQPATILRSVLGVLWYNIFATNDAVAKLGGNPYSNRGRFYFGSSNDWRLNLRVRRYDASPVARQAVKAYETSGDLTIPLVTLHTTADEIIPFWQEWRYAFKVHPTGGGAWVPIPVSRYGHCNFNASEALFAFLLLQLIT